MVAVAWSARGVHPRGNDASCVMAIGMHAPVASF